MQSRTRRRQAAVSALLCACVLLLVYWMRGAYPFGGNSVMVRDMYQQNVPFLYNFRDVITGQKSFFYDASLLGGIGNNTLALPEIVNPVNYILLLFDRAMIPLAVNVLVIVYSVLAALSASAFFTRAFPKNGLWNTVFSVGYALSGFFCYMYQILFWMMQLVIFPLILLAFYRLVQKRKGGLYAVLIGWSILLSQQLGAMTVFFVLFCGAIYLFRAVDKAQRRAAVFRLGVFTLLGAGIAMVGVIPFAASYGESMRSIVIPDYYKIPIVRLSELFDKVYMLFNPVACALFFVYCIKRVAKRREKALFARDSHAYWPTICALMVFTALYEPAAEMWHGGSHVLFPLRFGYMALFAFLCQASEAVRADWLQNEGQERFSVLSYALLAALLLAAAAVSVWKANDIAKGFETLRISRWARPAALWAAGVCVLVFLAGVLSILRKNPRVRARLSLAVALTGCFCMVTMSLFTWNSLDNYNAWAQLYETDLSQDGYVRVKGQDNSADATAALVSGKNALGGFVPLGSEIKYFETVGLLGYNHPWLTIHSTGGTLLSDALMRMGYRLSTENDTVANALMRAEGTVGQWTLYQNDYILPFGIVKSAQTLQSVFVADDVFENQNRLFEALTGESGALFAVRDIPVSENSAALTLANPDAGIFYLKLPEDIRDYETLQISINGQSFTPPLMPESEGIIELGYFAAGDISVEISSAQKGASIEGARIARMDFALFTKLFSEADVGNAEISIDGNRIFGTVAGASQGDMLLLPLARLQGFSAVVNGKAVDVEYALTGLLGVPLEAGDNDVEIVYTAPGFKLGAVCALASVLLLAAAVVLYRRGFSEPKWLCATAFAVYIAALAAGVIIIYGVSGVQSVLEYL